MRPSPPLLRPARRTLSPRSLSLWSLSWRRLPALALSSLILVGGGCAAPLSTVQRQEAARTAVSLLQSGQFDEATRAATQVLQADSRNPQAHLVAALTGYKAAMHQFSADLRTIPFQLFGRSFNHQYLRFSLQKTAAALAGIEEHLAAAASTPGAELELCLACWEVDWNQNGRIDHRDQRLFEIEIDTDGSSLPDGDPHRRPTFHFDLGDVYWARAMIAFQRALLEALQAFRWEEMDKIVRELDREDAAITIRIGDKSRIARARELVQSGLDHADRCRREYQAETDDDREWVPNPRQKSHPMPLPVDETLYRTWEEVTGDLRRLIGSREGLDVAELAQLGDHQWDNPPRGFVDIGRMLSDPSDIVIPLQHLNRLRRESPEDLLKSLLGRTYVEKMTPSPLLGRLRRMKAEVDRGEEALGRKLRYLLWLN